VIAFVVGTTAELIKIAPVFLELQSRGADPRLWYSDMHATAADELCGRLGLPLPHRRIGGLGGKDLVRAKDTPRWMAGFAAAGLAERGDLRRELRSDARRPLVLVHGDTFTTVLGALLGRSLGADVGHVEAGYRSGSLRSPFPEEANRRAVARIVSLNFAPGPREVTNLAHARGEVVDTGANTVVDSLKLLGADETGPGAGSGPGLVTLHRFELLSDDDRLREIMGLVLDAAANGPVRMLVGHRERYQLERIGLLERAETELELGDKLPYPDFVPVARASAWILTDSGGLQQEAAYLGVPCLIHRERVESFVGLDRNIVVSGMSADVVRGFLADPARHRFPSIVEEFHPSRIIVDALAERGYL
jgi:UDP-N-acetylglucosamine 2-epimerase (non-hydrolysing)